MGDLTKHIEFIEDKEDIDKIANQISQVDKVSKEFITLVWSAYNKGRKELAKMAMEKNADIVFIEQEDIKDYK